MYAEIALPEEPHQPVSYVHSNTAISDAETG